MIEMQKKKRQVKQQITKDEERNNKLEDRPKIYSIYITDELGDERQI